MKKRHPPRGKDGELIMPNCRTCGKPKQPLGRERSTPGLMLECYCRPGKCDGYEQEPHPSRYWYENEPGLPETES